MTNIKTTKIKTKGQMKRQRRVVLLGLLVPLMLLAFGLAYWAMNISAVYFYAPADITDETRAEIGNRQIRMGGLVKKGSYSLGDNNDHQFIITDLDQEMQVSFNGILPGLFREEQGAVVVGTLTENGFKATRVMAKHDENYMPREVQKALEESGQWKPEK